MRYLITLTVIMLSLTVYYGSSLSASYTHADYAQSVLGCDYTPEGIERHKANAFPSVVRTFENYYSRPSEVRFHNIIVLLHAPTGGGLTEERVFKYGQGECLVKSLELVPK